MKGKESNTKYSIATQAGIENYLKTFINISSMKLTYGDLNLKSRNTGISP